METNSVISIRSEDIIENLDTILENSTIFQTNANLETINCYIFYVENNRLLNYKKYEIIVNENKVSKKDLLSLVLKNNTFYSKKFDLVGIYKYEVNLEGSGIKEFCQDPKSFDFITQYHNIQDIRFQPCIEIFNENNNISLFFSRQQKEEESKNKDNKDNKDKLKSIQQNKNKTQKKVKFNLKQEKVNTPTKGQNKTQKQL
jgi:hypothetical protein